MSSFQMPSWSARNPLGIVALFISLIYGVSALLLGTSVKSLLPHNQDRLVMFVILFPVAVLGAFLWLVSRHHRKLYGPGDFRSDEGFLATDRAPEAIGEKYIAEASGSDDPEPTTPIATPSDGMTPVTRSEPGQARRVADAFLLEGLVFQELQNEFSGSVRREVTIRTAEGHKVEADGIIISEKQRILVEVLHARRQKNLLNAIRDKINLLIYAGRVLSPHEHRPVMPLLVVLASEDIGTIPEKEILGLPGIGSDVDIRIFRASELLEKYGLSKAYDRADSSG